MSKRHLLVLCILALAVLAACSTPATAVPPTAVPPAVAPTQAPAATKAPQPSAAPTQAATAAPTTQAPATASGAFSVTDALNRTVKFDKLPQRIVMAGKAYFMVADAVYLFPEAQQRVVAMPGTSPSGQGSGNFMALVDPMLNTKTIFASDVGAEQIAPTKPDVAILKTTANKLGDTLIQIGIPVVYVSFETPSEYERDLAILGKVLGNPERAQKLAAYYQGLVDRMNAKVKSLKDGDKPSVLLLQYAEKSGTVAFSVAPVDWIQTTMVETAGGRAIWKAASDKGGWAVVNLEQIAAWNPDMVFVINYFGNSKDAVAKIKADPKWQALNAVKNNKVYAFAGDFYSWDQADARWGLGLTWLATKIQPTLFGDINLNQEIGNLYGLYGIDQATVQSKVTPLFQGDLP